MGYTIPEGVDTMLDVVGVGWPNVDEDAYRDMADSLREFADDADDDAGAAYGHIQKLLSTGRSESLTALDRHWSKVQGKHKDLAKAARLVAGALDRVADIIVARKIAAVGELADLCATVGITLAFAPVTAGLSTLLAGAKIAATRQVTSAQSAQRMVHRYRIVGEAAHLISPSRHKARNANSSSCKNRTGSSTSPHRRNSRRPRSTPGSGSLATTTPPLTA
ncbi:WXG100-like domain-containing protein [Streptomyces sp. NBC_00259]|uniref:WXG100-like domain-containing protein n=1 Tax=Streptomyces sp. NBC_00259 TaxID=2903643 RepID=UPI003249555A